MSRILYVDRNYNNNKMLEYCTIQSAITPKDTKQFFSTVDKIKYYDNRMRDNNAQFDTVQYDRILYCN